jgi:polar amino acid transport system substrate-binding protein
LNRVTDGTMRVGIIDSPPWAETVGEKPSGIEIALVESFAQELQTRIDWVPGAEHKLMAALEERELDLVVGGLDQRTPWKKHVAITAPYTSTEVVVGAPSGVDLPEDLQGVRVAAERGSAEAGLLERETGADPLLIEDLADAHGRPAVADDFMLDDLGLEPTGETLDEDEHVWALVMGENAWQVRLERFLLGRESEIEAVIQREGKP